jgi:hypothetical protein
MNRVEVLDDAKQKVSVERASQHGDMENNFTTIADYWSVHLDVMMTLLKIARIKSNADNEDNWVDGCGYLACGGELMDRDG